MSQAQQRKMCVTQEGDKYRVSPVDSDHSESECEGQHYFVRSPPSSTDSRFYPDGLLTREGLAEWFRQREKGNSIFTRTE